jgi:hypothetical protein
MDKYVTAGHWSFGKMNIVRTGGKKLFRKQYNAVFVSE